MSRSKPVTKLALNFGSIAPVTANGVLSPCYIGPRYALHRIDNANTASAVPYTGGSLVNIPFPYRAEQSVIDTQSIKLKVSEALLQLNDTALTATIGANNYTLLFTEAVAGSDTSSKLRGNQVRAGDQIILSKASNPDVTAVVTAVSRTVSAAVISAATAVGTITGTGTPTTSGTFTGSTDTSYLITVVSVTADAAVVAFSNLAGDIGYSAEITCAKNTAVNVGNYGVKVTFTGADLTTLFEANDSYRVNCKPAGAGSFKVVTLSDNLPTGMQTGNLDAVFNSTSVTSNAIEVPNYFYTATEDDFDVLAGMTVSLYGNTYTVVSAKLQMEYRELLTDNTGVLVYGANDSIMSWLGEVHPDNPLSFMAYCGRLGGTTEYYVASVGNNTPAEYSKVLAKVSKYEQVYAPITYNQSSQVISEVVSKVNFYSKPEISLFKKTWVADNTPMESIVLEFDNEGQTVIGRLSADGKVTTYAGDLLASGVRPGDTLVITAYYDPETGVTSERRFPVITVSDIDTAYVSAGGLVIDAPVVMKFVRELNLNEYAQAVAAKAKAFNNYRVNYVWADTVNIGDFQNVDKVYLTCILAGLRAASAPHAPLTDVPISGITLADTLGLSEVDLAVMNDGGVWVCGNDSTGTPITYHQLTTTQSGTKAEEDSAVSNGDNIGRSLRATLYRYRGQANVTGDYAGQLSTDVDAALENIQRRVYPKYLGSQILSYDSPSITVKDTNKAAFVGQFNVAVPEPYLEGDYTLNLL